MPWSGLSEGSWFSLGRAVMSQLPDLDPHDARHGFIEPASETADNPF